MIKNIIFDLGGILLDIYYDKTTAAFQKLNISDFESKYSQAKQSDLFDNFEEGRITEVTFFNELKMVTDSSVPMEVLRDAWNAMLGNLPEDKLVFLEELKTDYNLVLLSNTNETHIRAFTKILQHQNLWTRFNQVFNKIYYSSDLKIRKPKSAAFKKVLSDNGFKASETLFIDDSPQHLEGAKIAQLHTLYIPSNMDIRQVITKFLDKAQLELR